MADINELNFDARSVEPNEALDAIPAGEYDVIIVASSIEPTKSGNGRFIKLELQVLSGQHQNRKLWDRLNIWNPNAQAVQIAKGTLSAICRAVNVMTPRSTEELHNKPLRCKVAVEDGQNAGEKRNAIKGYKPRHAGGATLAVAPLAARVAESPAQPATTAAAANGGAGRPSGW